MKGVIIFFSAMVVVMALIIYSIRHENDDRTYFTGYIPLNAKPIVKWDSTGNGPISGRYTIDVIKDNGDTIKASCPIEGMILGSLLIRFRDSYPLAVGKMVYVKGYYTDSKNPYLQEAELYKFK